jgi:membrane-associated protease RseP (regulator of RpoE activity)
MIRNTLVALLAVAGLTTWGTAESFAQGGPGLYLKPQGVVVTQVLPGSTAARQGIEVGDIIVSVDGHSIRSQTDLQYRLGQAGRAADLGLIDVRTGWQNEVTVYPTQGRLGVDVRPTSWDGGRPIHPIRPITPPWTPGVRPLPLPINPGSGVRPLPLPAPGPVLGR